MLLRILQKRYRNYFAIKKWQTRLGWSSIYLYEKSLIDHLNHSDNLRTSNLFEVYFEVFIWSILLERIDDHSPKKSNDRVHAKSVFDSQNTNSGVKRHFVGSMEEATAVAIRWSDPKNSRWESNGFLERRSRAALPRSWYRQFIWLKTSFRCVSFRPKGFIPLSCQSA